MKDGKIEQVGTPDDLYDRPATLFVADFVGSPSMNFIEGRVEAEDGKPVFVSDKVRLALPDDTSVEAGRQVICGLRPTDLFIDAAGGLNGTLTLAEKTGAEVNLHLEVTGRDIIATVPRDTAIETGAPCQLSIAADKIHLFDQETTRRC